MNQRKPVISQTGTIHGRGSMPYRWVSGLTATERALVRDGGTVLVRDENQHYMCTPYKMVTFYRGHYGHRNWEGVL